MQHRRVGHSSHTGFSLIELLLVIVILGIAAATLTVVSARSAEMSASVIKQQQARTLADGMLEEIKAMPFTYCEPSQDLPHVSNAAAAADCAVLEVPPAPFPVGPDGGGGENRVAPPAFRFDNVNDYNGLNIPAGTLQDASGALVVGALPSLSNCQVRAAVSRVVMPALPPNPAPPATEALRIVVTVTCPDLIAPVMAETIRMRYAPRRYLY